MRRDLIARCRVGGATLRRALEDLLQRPQFLLQPIDQLLLAKHGAIQRVERVFRQRDFRFELRDAVRQVVRVSHRWMIRSVGLELDVVRRKIETRPPRPGYSLWRKSK